METKSITPIFRMFDEAKARAHYIDYLGFKIHFEHRFHDGAPLYMGLHLGRCELHLSEHHGDASPGASAKLEVDDVRAFHASLDPDYKFAKPGILEQSYGTREVHIKDPFNNTLIFFEDM
ncbi:MAG: glyoxalase superfamily protein [Pseudomonadota bacterium]